MSDDAPICTHCRTIELVRAVDRDATLLCPRCGMESPA